MSQILYTKIQTILDYDVTLTEQEKRFVKTMMTNNPQCFTDIDTTIINIIKDGIINIHDIPNIILLVTQIFKTYCLNVKNMNMTNIVIFIVNVTIDLLPISDSEHKLAKKIADASISLLATNLNTVEKYASDSCCKPIKN